jgi:hypothetical protein
VNAHPIRQRVIVENDSTLVSCQSAAGALAFATEPGFLVDRGMTTFGGGNGHEVGGGPSAFDDVVGNPFVVKAPVTARLVVWRVQNRVLDDSGHQLFIHPFVTRRLLSINVPSPLSGQS